MSGVAMALGAVMVDLEGTELNPAERQLLLHPACGGVILFSRNFESPGQVSALTTSILALRDPPLLVAVDQEGGRIQRFRDGFTPLPPAARFGQIYDSDPGHAVALSESAGRILAIELRQVGIDISFAPVLDLAEVESEVIGDRAFHRQPKAVTALAGAFVKGMARAGMRATGKHFPGHGGVAADSHLETPVDPRPIEEIESRDLIPFTALHRDLGGVMTAHVQFPQIDEELPTFSSFWLQQMLRRKIGFEGLIFSDDLTMRGAESAGDPPARARKALMAGCDMVLVCNDPSAAEQVLTAVGKEAHPIAQRRLRAMHGCRGESLVEAKRRELVGEIESLS